MNAKKVTADQKLAFVNKIIGSDVFNSSDVAAVAILQQLVDSAKKEIATQNVEKLDKQLRQEGKTIANKNKIVKMTEEEWVAAENNLKPKYTPGKGISFYIAKEISDEEIKEKIEKALNNFKQEHTVLNLYPSNILQNIAEFGAKWYRERLKI
jgi:N-acetylglucosamine kinase-like BadF-type ATPase